MTQFLETTEPAVAQNGLVTNKNASIGGTLTVTGAATLSSTVAITSAITPTGGVAAAGGFSVSARGFSAGRPASVSTDGNDSTPVTTETYIGEVFVPANTTLTGVAVFNGSVATNGNVNVGLANSSGVVVASSLTTTAMSGTDAYQRVPFSATYAAVGPATYYILTQYSSGSDRYNAWSLGNFGAAKKTSETYGTFTTVTAPTTFVTNLATIASLY
jgi:hypothetical protein